MYLCKGMDFLGLRNMCLCMYLYMSRFTYVRNQSGAGLVHISVKIQDNIQVLQDV